MYNIYYNNNMIVMWYRLKLKLNKAKSEDHAIEKYEIVFIAEMIKT